MRLILAAVAALLLALPAHAQLIQDAGVQLNCDAGNGSGTVVAVTRTADGWAHLVLTAGHVAERSKTWRITTADGRQATGQVLQVATAGDVACLTFTTAEKWPAARLAEASPAEGQTAWKIAFGGGRLDARAGQVVKPWGAHTRVRVLTRLGDSGGGIFDARGQLAGVLVGWDKEDGPSVAVAEPIDRARKLCDACWPPAGRILPHAPRQQQPQCPDGFCPQPRPQPQPQRPQHPDYRLDELRDELVELRRLIEKKPCPPGPQGPAGPQGPQGPPGQAGKCPDLESKLDALAKRLDCLQRRLDALDAPGQPSLPGEIRIDVEPAKPSSR